MQHQHIKKSEQTHQADSEHNSVKHAHRERLDVQSTGVPLYLQRQPVEEEEELLQPKLASASIQRQPMEEEEEMLQPSRSSLPAIQAKLTIGAPDDEYEREADRVADQVMRMPDPTVQRQAAGGGGRQPIQTNPIANTITPLVQRQVEPEEEEEEAIQTKSIAGNSSPLTSGLHNQIQSFKGGGHPLPKTERMFFEPRFGVDFSNVRIHNDMKAANLAQSINAHAFTFRNNVVFGAGKYLPNLLSGKKLLAHELTHVVQQDSSGGINGRCEKADGAAIRDSRINGRKGGNSKHTAGISIRQVVPAKQVQRDTPATSEHTDPLCHKYVYLIDKIIIEGLIKDLKKTSDVEKRMKLIRDVKWVLRCGTQSQKSEIKTMLKAGLGKASASIWKEAGTPFGGYRGVFPGYYGGARRYLKRLGVSKISPYKAFAYNLQSGAPATFRTRREAAATTQAKVLTATDILYFYGHQYAQYNNPGVFANGIQTQFIDLRALAGKGDFSRVKLIISTSCATCCKEAVETFAPIFPNAVILGYRKSAPMHGKAVRNDFDKGIRSLKRPLLLNQPVDVNTIIGVWKSVVKRHHPRENKRLPGYYQNGIVHYLELGVWKSMPATGAVNTCKKKGSRIEEAVH